MRRRGWAAFPSTGCIFMVPDKTKLPPPFSSSSNPHHYYYYYYYYHSGSSSVSTCPVVGRALTTSPHPLSSPGRQ